MKSLLRRSVTRSLLLAMTTVALIFPAVPAQAAWGTTVPLTLQIRHYWQHGGSVQLGWVEGTFQFDDGGSAMRYDLKFCRQSSYMLPYMAIYVKPYTGGRAFITNVYPNYTSSSTGQPCYSTTGTASGEFSYPNFTQVEFIAYGSTFEGSNHVVKSQDRVWYNPY